MARLESFLASSPGWSCLTSAHGNKQLDSLIAGGREEERACNTWIHWLWQAYWWIRVGYGKQAVAPAPIVPLPSGTSLLLPPHSIWTVCMTFCNPWMSSFWQSGFDTIECWWQDDVSACFEYYADLAEKLDERQYAPLELPMEQFKCNLLREPIGVVALITPWSAFYL